MGSVTSGPLVSIKPTVDNNHYVLPKCVQNDLKNGRKLNLTDEKKKKKKSEEDLKKFEEFDQNIDIDKFSYEPKDWLEATEINFIQPNNPIYEDDSAENHNTTPGAQLELDEKLVLDVLTGHLSRFCESELKCTLDDLVNEFNRAHADDEDLSKKTPQEIIQYQVEFIESKFGKKSITE